MPEFMVSIYIPKYVVRLTKSLMKMVKRGGVLWATAALWRYIHISDRKVVVFARYTDGEGFEVWILLKNGRFRNKIEINIFVD